MTNQSIIQSLDENQAAKILGVAVLPIPVKTPCDSVTIRHPVPE